jgi:hypothetical protein
LEAKVSVIAAAAILKIGENRKVLEVNWLFKYLKR